MDQFQRMKEIKFPNVTYKNWEEKVEATLKGKSVESLNSSTYEGIIRKPLYTEEDLRGINNAFPRGKHNDWLVSQKLPGQLSLLELNSILLEELNVGLQAINFNNKEVNVKSTNDFKTLFHSINLIETPLHIYVGKDLTSFYNLLKEYLHTENIPINAIRGYVGIDPIGEFALTGKRSEVSYGALVPIIKEAIGLKTIWVRSEPYHEAGANAVQELAATMATAVEYITALTNEGLSIEEAANTIVFSYNIGSDLFMELAKIRVAKMMWATIIEQFGGSTIAQEMTIHATTSSINKSILDEHVNMLRTTTEAFSAVLAGVSSLNIDSFSITKNSFSRRIARNTHYVLKEESFLNKVVDPASGSYYIESLTHELSQRAWSYFQKIEKQGGIIPTLKSNELQQEIQEIANNRVNDVKTRKKRLVGVNMYPNLADMIVPPDKNLSKLRIAEAFETLRLQSEQFKGIHGQHPTITLLNIGKLKDHKARTDFATGFFQVGGLHIEQSPSLETLDAIKTWLTNEWKSNAICVCGTDTAYDDQLHYIVNLLKEINPNSFIIVAGNRDLEGVDEYIHLKSNCYDQLLAIQTVLGVNKNEA